MDFDRLKMSEDLMLEDQTAEYFVCGPVRFMVDMTAKLKELGVDGERIQSEVFGPGDIPQ